jgi:hypothetical protein
VIALARRLKRLEAKLIPYLDHESKRMADLIWESRRRRLEAAGEPYEGPRPETISWVPGRRVSIAEQILEAKRRRAYPRPAQVENGEAE